MGKKIASGKKIVGKRVSGEIHTLQKHGIDKGDNMLLADVYGVGNILTERLAKAGFLTVGDVRKNPEKALEVEGFGPQKLAVLGIKAPKRQKSVKKTKMEVKTVEKTIPKKSGEAPKQKESKFSYIPFKEAVARGQLKNEVAKISNFDFDEFNGKKGQQWTIWLYKPINREDFAKLARNAKVERKKDVTIIKRQMKYQSPEDAKRDWETTLSVLQKYGGSLQGGLKVDTETRNELRLEDILSSRDASFYNVPTFFTRKIKEAGYKPDKIAQDTPHALRIYIKAPDGNLAHAVWDKDRGVFFIRELRDGETKTTFKIEGLPKYNKTLDLGQSKLDTSKDALVKKLEQDDEFAIIVEKKGRYGKYEKKEFPRVWVSNDNTKIRVYLPDDAGYVGVNVDDIDNIQIEAGRWGDRDKLEAYAKKHGEDIKRLAKIYKAKIDAVRVDGVKNATNYYAEMLRRIWKKDAEVHKGEDYTYAQYTRNGRTVIVARLVTDKQLSKDDFKSMMAGKYGDNVRVQTSYEKKKDYGVTVFSVDINAKSKEEAEKALQEKIKILKKYRPKE